MARREEKPVPTIGQLHSHAPHWLWAFCNRRECSYHRALPLAPFVIRYGPDVSSDYLREHLKCSKCGHKGVSLQVPSWVDMQTGEQPFPRAPGNLSAA